MPHKDPEAARKYHADYHKQNRERILTRKSLHQRSPEEQVRKSIYSANYYRLNHKRLNAKEKLRQVWGNMSPEQREVKRARTLNYIHHKRANGGTFLHATWEYMKTLFGNTCTYCKRRIERLTQDHVIPISKGGWHFSGNIVPACKPCNSSKGSR